MSIGSILSSALQYTSVMQSTPASATSNAVQPSAPQSGGSFEQALSSVNGSAQPSGISQASGAASPAKPHHGGHHHGGGGSSSASQTSTLLSTLSSLAGPSLDISV